MNSGIVGYNCWVAVVRIRQLHKCWLELADAMVVLVVVDVVLCNVVVRIVVVVTFAYVVVLSAMSVSVLRCVLVRHGFGWKYGLLLVRFGLSMVVVEGCG